MEGCATFDEYIEQHGARLYRLCLKLCDTVQDAEDLYQETWIKAYKNKERFDDSREFEPWITSICVNLYRDYRRRQKWLGLFAGYRTIEEKDAALEQVAQMPGEDFSWIRDAVSDLPEKLRLAVILHYFNGLDVKKTGVLLHIPEGTVKYRLHRARELLKGRLKMDEDFFTGVF